MAELIYLGEFMTEGEKQTAKLLAKRLSDDWVVLCNKTLVPPSAFRGRSMGVA